MLFRYLYSHIMNGFKCDKIFLDELPEESIEFMRNINQRLMSKRTKLIDAFIEQSLPGWYARLVKSSAKIPYIGFFFAGMIAKAIRLHIYKEPYGEKIRVNLLGIHRRTAYFPYHR